MPIYLYVKQHSITGLKYFGKTKHDPNTYPGSGYFWKKHYTKYGREHIITLNVWQFEDQQKCTDFALVFSKENNIVESNEWANRIVEDGLGGGCYTGPKSEIHRKNISKGRKGIKFSASHRENIRRVQLGKIMSEEARRKMSEAHKGKIKTPEHQAKITEKMKGRKHSEETKRKMSEAKKNISEETKRKLSEAKKGNKNACRKL